MEKLAISDYSFIQNYLDELPFTPTFAYSVLDHFVDGDVYVNSRHNITSVLIRLRNGIYFAAGGDNELKRFIQTSIDHAQMNRHRFTLFCSVNRLGDTLKTFHRIKEYKRISFQRYKKNLIHQLSTKYTIAYTNKGIITKSNEFSEAYYSTYWESVDHFLNKGLGVCILDEDTILAECVSIFKSNKYAEIDIYTNERYQGRGIGQLAAKAFIELAQKELILPRWDCDIKNAASIKLAQKLGFHSPQEYAVYSLDHGY